MDCTFTRLPYRQTGAFTNIVLDYIDQSPQLKPFFGFPPTLQGIQKTIEARKKNTTKRDILVKELKKQYNAVRTSNAVQKNIEALLSENTFTVTTAHQPNIFTGQLYFIYKILHAVKLADYLKTSLPQYNFVPVFYMGSEDADIDELGHIYLDGQKLEWKTKQTGAVGKMKVDKEFIKLIELMKGQLAVLPHGNETISLLKDCYKEGVMIQDATFQLVNALFGEYGLIVLIPDNAEFKKQMIPVFEDDLLNQTASAIVEKTSTQLGELYKIQANPREINLFYLKDNIRERIIKQNSKFKIQNSTLSFTEEEIKKELTEHPEYFSPNVILRGVYQETILPNVVYIGGGGEVAYWLQLKELFEHYKTPYPALLLRNSFLIVEKKWQEKISKLGFTVEDFFLSEQELMNRLVKKESKQEVKLNGTFTDTEQLYETIKKHAAAVDNTLAQHVDALKAQSLHRLQELEKKMLRAEKRKFSDQQRQIHTVKEKLFPANGLQERYDNMLFYYAKWGKEFISKLYEHSLGLEEEFVVLNEL
ncbi:MAG: bacillithiol biosynthesis cysteine-adding enzyme BshC [Chitinophagales bacterium]